MEPDPNPWAHPTEGEHPFLPVLDPPWVRSRAGAAPGCGDGDPKAVPTSWREGGMLTPPLHPASTPASRIHSCIPHPRTPVGIAAGHEGVGAQEKPPSVCQDGALRFLSLSFLICIFFLFKLSSPRLSPKPPPDTPTPPKKKKKEKRKKRKKEKRKGRGEGGKKKGKTHRTNRRTIYSVHSCVKCSNKNLWTSAKVVFNSFFFLNFQKQRPMSIKRVLKSVKM